MIKKLRLKFVLVFLVLVVSIFITSSCYASEEYTYKDFNITIDKDTKTLTVFHVPSNSSKTIDISYGLDNYSNYYFHINSYNKYPSSWSEYYNFGLLFSEDFSWKDSTSNSLYAYSNANSYVYYFNFGVSISGSYLFGTPYNNSDLGFNEDNSMYYSRKSYVLSLDYDYNYKYPDTEILTASHTITAPNGTVLYEFSEAIDTTFNYSLSGVKRGQVNLEISNLNSSLKMYGYVGAENTFEISDIFVSGSLSEYLRLISMNSDNSDLSCSLYEGENLLYYIVDEDNVILDIGYISELAEGYFLYGFPVSDGVDFVFLKDGQVYWNNDLTFKYQVNGGNLSLNSTIVSIGVDSFISSDKTQAKLVYNGFVYDSNGDILFTAVANAFNDLSNFLISVDTYYQESGFFNKVSIYGIKRIDIEGTDSNGNVLDFTNYTIRWSVPTWLILDVITVNGTETDKYNGVFSDFHSFGVLYDVNLEIKEKIKNHTKNFDISFEIYDPNGDLVTTYIVNSDDIVKNQIASEENNIDKPSYDIVDNPNYTGGSGNKDFSNIQNWTEDDYKNLMSTDNFIWSFFKAILGNLPWWLTVPLTILIFGVVIITLIRFARGA